MQKRLLALLKCLDNQIARLPLIFAMPYFQQPTPSQVSPAALGLPAVMSAYISARRPADVAREVESLRKGGCSKFTLRRLDGGAMVDLERLGAARYAAGLQAEVEFEGPSSPAGAVSGGAGG